MIKIERGIDYFEDAVRESDEIIDECSPALQAGLTEQKEHFIIALQALREKREREKRLGDWISADDRLPDKFGLFLAVYQSGQIGIMSYDPEQKHWRKYGANMRPTHWMPLPETPGPKL